VRGTTYWWKHRQHGGDEETRQESNSRAQKLDRVRGKQEFQKIKKRYLWAKKGGGVRGKPH
jgi:hypothetical protein